MYTFKVLQANSEVDADLLASMHQLRYQVFHKELKWKAGLQIYNCMEFDEFDQDDWSYYIVRINNVTHKVDEACRLRPTTKPYMLKEHYAHFVETEPLPQSDQEWEITRTYTHPEARTNGKAIAQLLTASVEFGLVKGVKNYVSLTTDHLLPMLERGIGWDPHKLGDKKPTPDDVSYALKYTVSYPMLQRMRQRNKIEKPLLYDFDETLKNTRELWHDNTAFQKDGGSDIFIPRPKGISGGDSFRSFLP